MTQRINKPSAGELATGRHISDKDMGYKDLVLFFEKVGGIIAKAGFVEGKADPRNVFKATINHFGGTSSEYGNPIPPRPFIADAFDENATEYSAEMEEILGSFFDSKGKIGPEGVEKKMKQLAARVAGDIDASLLAWSDPPNAEQTVFLKGFNDPLVETGAMANDIDFEVTRYAGEAQLNRQLKALSTPASARSGGGGSGGGFGGAFAKAATAAASALARSPGYEGGGIRAAPERRTNVTGGVASSGTRRRGANLSTFKL